MTSIDEAWLRVFVDDDFEHRRPPSDEWEQVTTAHEAIALLETDRVIELSLDHDLGDEEEAGRGLDVVTWLAEQQELHGRIVWPRDGITVHTANAVGRDNIARAIRHEAGRRLTVCETRVGGKPRFEFAPHPAPKPGRRLTRKRLYSALANYAAFRDELEGEDDARGPCQEPRCSAD